MKTLGFATALILTMTASPARTGINFERLRGTEANPGNRFSLAAPNDSTDVRPLTSAIARDAYAKLPLSFEQNQAQIASPVKFISHGFGYTFSLTPTEALLAFEDSQEPSRSSRATLPEHETPPPTAILRMRFLHSNPHVALLGVDRLPGHSNYFLGPDPAQWHTQIPLYSKVRYSGIYPDIDLLFYGTKARLEYDFLIAPQADPEAILIRFDSVQSIRLLADTLILHTSTGDLKQPPPHAYQLANGIKLPVSAHYQLTSSGAISFTLGKYDRTRPLIIDPTLRYSTYLGGSSTEWGQDIAVDAKGNAYIIGYTCSPDFPITPSAYQTTLRNCYDAFVTKLSSDGSSLVYSTFLGGSDIDEALALAVDASGNVLVAGVTCSTDFPVTAGVVQGSPHSCYDGFITKLNASGDALSYSTYVGGDNTDYLLAIVVDEAGAVYVTGLTSSSDFPTTSGAFRTVPAGGSDAFVTKLNASGTAFTYSSYLGGTGYDEGFGIAVDGSGSAYATGLTCSSDLPVTPGAFQTVLAGCDESFVSKFTPTGENLTYSTYLGGSSNDVSYSIALDASGAALCNWIHLFVELPCNARSVSLQG